MIPIPSLEIPHCDSPPSFSTDHFRMFQFKVRSCPRGRSHDWTECPYAHPAEKARRRDPRKFHYSGTACPDYRKGNCKRGNTCQFAHGVFECWLHPSRYRTQLCKDGTNCCRRVCFFAHTNDQLRLVTSDSPYGVVLSVGEIINSMRNEYSVFGFINLNGCEEEPAMERVESGKDIRARIYAKLIGASVSAPDIGWVSELGSV